MRELRKAGRRGPPNVEVGDIFAAADVLDGRTNERRELLPPNDGTFEELGLNADTDPLERRGPAKGRRLDATAVFTDVALIVGIISVGVIIAGPFDELFFFGLNVGLDLELPKGRMTGVKPFFFDGNFDFESSSSSSSPS